MGKTTAHHQGPKGEQQKKEENAARWRAWHEKNRDEYNLRRRMAAQGKTRKDAVPKSQQQHHHVQHMTVATSYKNNSNKTRPKTTASLPSSSLTAEDTHNSVNYSASAATPLFAAMGLLAVKQGVPHLPAPAHWTPPLMPAASTAAVVPPPLTPPSTLFWTRTYQPHVASASAPISPAGSIAVAWKQEASRALFTALNLNQ